jgi:ribosome maturation factor RimP
MTDAIQPALEKPLADLSLVVDELTVTPAGRRRVVRVVVDRDLSGLDRADTTSRVSPLTLDEVADATRVVSGVLDEGDLIGDRPYTLEVSSPGVDRSLRGHRAFRRNVGRLVALVLESGGTLDGRIVSVSVDQLELEVPVDPKAPATRRQVALDDITSARVRVEFNHAADQEPGDDVDDADEPGGDVDDDEEPGVAELDDEQENPDGH